MPISPISTLRWRLRNGRATRRIWRLQPSRLFNQHPEIADVFGDSRIAAGQVDAMASAQQHPRAGNQFAGFVALFLGQAERLEHDNFAEAIKHFIVQADQDGAYADQAIPIGSKLMIGKRAHRESMRLAGRATECQQPPNSAGLFCTRLTAHWPSGQQPPATLPVSTSDSGPNEPSSRCSYVQIMMVPAGSSGRR